jgi:hypothetical protein
LLTQPTPFASSEDSFPETSNLSRSAALLVAAEA